MSYTLMPAPIFTMFSDGAVVPGGKLYTYATGSNDPLDVFSDAAGTPYAQPVVMNGDGQRVIYFQALPYRLVATDADDVPIFDIDPVEGVPAGGVDMDEAGVAGEHMQVGAPIYLSDGSDGRTAGRWYHTHATQTYASSAAFKVGYPITEAEAGDGFTVRTAGRVTGLAGLVPGSLYYLGTNVGSLALTPPGNVRLVGIAESTTVLSIWPNPMPFLAESARNIIANQVFS